MLVTKTKTELLCFGNAIADVFAKVDFARLDRLGITEPVQHIGRDQAELILGELNRDGRNGPPILSSGGGAANAAKIAAMMGIGVSFAGCAGQDALGSLFEQDLRDAGVVPFLTKGTEKTGVCLILADGGKTRLAASPGAALEFTEADVREDLIGGAGVVVIDGYMLDRRPLVQRILQQADKYGIPVALDAASVFQIREKTEEILHYSRNYPLIIFMNARESIAFYNTIKKGGVNRADGGEEQTMSEREKEAFILREICPALKGMTEGELFPILVIKLGGRGAAVLANGNVYREETFTIIPRNTVGAGDAFCAAFLSAWIRGKSISECAALGNRVAREILEVPGTRINGAKLKPFASRLR